MTDLAKFQADLRETLKGIEHPRVLAVLALGEEVGEIEKCVLDHEGYGKDVKEALAGEIGDALAALVEVAERYGVSIDECAATVLAKIRKNAPTWKAELAGRLEKLRRRMDDPV